jgi:hypothetical protein
MTDMKLSMPAGYAVALLVALLLTIWGRVDGSSVESNEDACLRGWSQAALADAFGLIELSERCWDAERGQLAVELVLLAELRLRTDRDFLKHALNSDEAWQMSQLRDRFHELESLVRGQILEHPDTVTLIMERIAHFNPVLPPIYQPRLSLQTDTLTYGQEFSFRRAALMAELQHTAELAQHPELRDVMMQLHALLDEEIDAPGAASESIKALQDRAQDLSEMTAREVAERTGANEIVALIRSHGIYLPVGESRISEGMDTAFGEFLDFDDFVHVETTETIPVRWNESFGLEVDLAGVPVNVPIEMEWSVHHGPLPGHDGHPSSHSRERLAERSTNGTLSFSKFSTFVEGLAVACGPWLFELLYEGEVLVSQSFFVHGCD